jgi:predicted DNA-binding transcriptional regulator YafY
MSTGVGCSTYVIGHAVKTDYDGMYTFKLDRIKKAELLEASFEIPPAFDMDRLLAGAWGIVWGEEIMIKLKFYANVCRRLKETRWHASQIIIDLPDRSCIMSLKVGSTLEIIPWIRSWGPDVEVVEPKELRLQFARWARELSAIYSGGG